MGGRLSSIGDKARDIRVSIRNWVKRVIRRPTNRNMVQHALVLIDVLKFGPLKLKIRRIKNQDDVTDIKSDGSDLLSNLDVLSGMGTAGGTRTLPTDYHPEDSDSGHDSELEDVVDVNPTQALGDTKVSTRNKSIATLAGHLMDKLKGDYKTVDLFAYKLKKKTRSMTSRSMLNHALDCHQAVVELEANLKNLLEAMEAKSKVNNQRPSRTLSRLRRKNKTLKRSGSLLRPGTKMEGVIRVPAQSIAEDSEDEDRLENLDQTLETLQQDRDRPYQLEILREAKDEVGESYLIGRHQTYDGRRDKQTILMKVYQENQEVLIKYQDYETHCEGEVDEDTAGGFVQQLKRGQPGFFVQTRSREDYKFYLRRTDDSKYEKLNDLRAKIYLARSARALAFAAWCGSASESRVRNEKFTGTEIRWNQVIDDMAWICDEVGNTLRRFVGLLDGLRFENAQHRKQRMENLSERGLRRQRVHEFWDAATILLARVKETTPSGSMHSDIQMRTTMKFAEKVVRRIEPVYQRFDVSLRRAERRVCDDLRNSFIQVFKPDVRRMLDSKSFSSSSRKGSKENPMAEIQRSPSKKTRKLESKMSQKSLESDEDEVLCTICMDGFAINERIYVTSCAHAFHMQCLDEAFDKGGSSNCPICRKDFSQFTDE